MAFDCAVNQGAGSSAMMMQRAVGATPDGHIGPASLAAIAAAAVNETIQSFSVERMSAYRNAAGWPVFGRGWTTRLDTITAQALAWAAGGLNHDGC